MGKNTTGQVRRMVLTGATVATATVLAMISPLSGSAAPSPASPQRFTIAAAPGYDISASAIEKLIVANDLTLVETQTFYAFKGTTLTIGVPVGTGETLEQAIRATLADLVDAQNGVTDVGTDGMPALLVSAQADLSAGAKVHQIVVESPDQKVDLPATLSVVPAPTTKAPPAAKAAACGTWNPVLVSNTAAASSAGGRYDSLKFTWSPTRLAALRCTGSSTFEPDFVTYNYDSHYYFSSTMLAWATTMPSGYWDTNFLDAPQERVYTVGSANTATVLSNHTYEAYFRMSNGNFASDTAKVVWQRGFYLVGCPSGPAFCIFADASVIQYAWTIPLPGTF